MEEYNENTTKGAASDGSFVPIKIPNEEKTIIGESPADLDGKLTEDRGLGGLVNNVVESFEKKFATAFFILVVLGYIIIESFGNHSINLSQYLKVVTLGLIFYCLLKWPSRIFSYLLASIDKIKSRKWIVYLIYGSVIILCIYIYLYYGKPILLFEKKNKGLNNNINTNLIIREIK